MTEKSDKTAVPPAKLIDYMTRRSDVLSAWLETARENMYIAINEGRDDDASALLEQMILKHSALSLIEEELDHIFAFLQQQEKASGEVIN